MKKLHWIGMTLILTTMAGCDGTIHKTSMLGDTEVLSVDARQRLIFAKNGLICSEPSPDAVVAQAAIFAAQANAEVTGKGSGGAGIQAGLSESVASIGTRTQTVQLLRDGYYRACEARLNRLVDAEGYENILYNVDRTMVALIAIDALGGTTRAPAVAIGTKIAFQADAEGKLTKLEEGLSGAEVEKITAAAIASDGARAKAIEHIVRAYLANTQHRFPSGPNYRPVRPGN